MNHRKICAYWSRICCRCFSRGIQRMSYIWSLHLYHVATPIPCTCWICESMPKYAWHNVHRYWPPERYIHQSFVAMDIGLLCGHGSGKGEEVEVLLTVRRYNLCLHLLIKILAHLRLKIWTDQEYSKKLYMYTVYMKLSSASRTSRNFPHHPSWRMRIPEVRLGLKIQPKVKSLYMSCRGCNLGRSTGDKCSIPSLDIRWPLWRIQGIASKH